MGRYMRNCKRIAEVAVMEQSGETAEGRKRKAGLGESELAATSVQLKTQRLAVVKPENSASPASSEESTCESADSEASCCSSNGLTETAPAKEGGKFVDLEEEKNEAPVELLAGDSVEFRDRRETTPSSEIQAESGELESTARPRETNSRRRRPTAAKMPSEAELEDFFSAAEKNLQKEFIDKYNYDIVKDEPLEGRYEWVEIQQKP